MVLGIDALSFSELGGFNHIKNILSYIEHQLDFSDDDAPAANHHIVKSLGAVKRKLSTILKTSIISSRVKISLSL